MSPENIEIAIYKLFLESGLNYQEFYKLLKEINERILYMNINE